MFAVTTLCPAILVQVFWIKLGSIQAMTSWGESSDDMLDQTGEIEKWGESDDDMQDQTVDIVDLSSSQHDSSDNYELFVADDSRDVCDVVPVDVSDISEPAARPKKLSKPAFLKEICNIGARINRVSQACVKSMGCHGVSSIDCLKDACPPVLNSTESIDEDPTGPSELALALVSSDTIGVRPASPSDRVDGLQLLPVQRTTLALNHAVQDNFSDLLEVMSKYEGFIVENPVATKMCADLAGDYRSWFSAKTLIAHAKKLEVTTKDLVSKAQLYAASALVTAIHMFKRQLRWICQLFRGADGECKTLFTFRRYDETPLKMAILNIDTCLELHNEAALNALLKENFESMSMRDTGVAKLLVMEYQVVASFKLNNQCWAFRWKIPVLVDLVSFPKLVFPPVWMAYDCNRSLKIISSCSVLVL